MSTASSGTPSAPPGSGPAYYANTDPPASHVRNARLLAFGEQPTLPCAAPPSGFPVRTSPAYGSHASQSMETATGSENGVRNVQDMPTPGGGYLTDTFASGHQVPPAQTQTPPATANSDGSDHIQQFANAIHALPIGRQNQQNQHIHVSGPLPTHILHSMDKNLYRITLLVEHKRTLVSHLNQMCKALRIGTYGLKKEKQERLLTLAQRLRSRGEFEGLQNMRNIVDNEGPVELRPLESSRSGPSAQVHTQVLPSHYYQSHPQQQQQQSASLTNAASYGMPTFSTGPNPLVAPQKPGVVLSFRKSPFYQLERSLVSPILFTKPYARRRVSQMVTFECDPQVMASPETCIFLVCQEYNPRARDQQPVYFPFYNELILDEEVISANTRGVRGVPGSARPVDLKPIITKHPGRHRLRINIVINDQGDNISDKSFAFGVYYGKKSNNEKLVEEIQNRPHIDLNHTRQMAMRAASPDEGDDVVMSSDAVYSLKDSVMMTRIQVPIRSKACMHIQCFDAMTFVMLQDQAETWKCPICNKTITWESLAVDDFFTEILSSAGPDVDTVSINADGSWSVENTDSTDEEDSDSEDEKKPSLKRSRPEPDTEVVELLSETDDEDPSVKPQTKRTRSSQPQAQKSQAQPQHKQQSDQQSDPQRGEQEQFMPPALNPAEPSISSDSYEPNVENFPDEPSRRSTGTIEGQPSNNAAGDDSHTSFDSAIERQPPTPEVARQEIFAQIRAFQKSHNLMFDAPLRLDSEYTLPETSNDLNSTPPERPQSQPRQLQKQQQQQQQQQLPSPQLQPQQQHLESPPPNQIFTPNQYRRQLLGMAVWDNNEDDIVDLTGDD